MSDKIKSNIISKIFDAFKDMRYMTTERFNDLTNGLVGLVDNTVVKVQTFVKPKEMLERMSRDSVDSYDRVSNPFLGDKQPTFKDIASGAKKYTKLTSWGQTHAKTIEKITKAITYLKDWKTVGGEAKFAGIENLKFLKTENLQMLDAKQINSVLDFLSDIYAVTQKYDALRPDPSKPNKSSIDSPNRVEQKKAFLKSFEIYKDILEKVDTHISKVDDIKNFGIDSYADSLYKLGKDQNSPEQIDAEVVRALEFVGITLKKDEKGKWAVDFEATKANHHGIELVDDKGDPYYFKLGYEKPNDPIQSFLDNYLNKEPNERNGLVITGQGIFELYKRSASPEMGIIDKLKNLKDLGDIKQQTEQFEKTYNLDSTEWKLFNMTRQDKVMDDATKLSLAFVYMNLCSVSLDDVLDQDMSDALRLNQYTKSSLTWRRVNGLCDTATYFRNLANEQIASDACKDTYLNILMTNDEYDKQISNFEEILKNRELTPKEESIYNDLKKAEKTLQFVRRFQVNAINKVFENDFADKERNNEKLKEDILSFVTEFESCEFLSVEREGVDFKLVFDQSKLPEGLQVYSAQFEEIVKNINAKEQNQNQSSAQTNPTQTRTTHTSSINFDVKLPYLQDVEAFNLLMNSDNVNVVEPLEQAEILERCKFLLNNGQDNELTAMRDVLRTKFPGKKMTEIFEICKSSVQDPSKAQQLANDGIDIELFNSMFDGTENSWCMTPEIFAMVCDNDLEAMRAVENERKLVLDSVIETNSRLNDRLKTQSNPNDISNEIKQSLAEGLYKDVYSDFSKNPNARNISDAKRQRADELRHEYHNNSTLNAVDKIHKNNENTKCSTQFTNSQMVKDATEEESQKQEESQKEVQYKEHKTTYGDKNKKFDMEALNKKLKPYAKDWLTKWLENLIKMIDKIEIIEKVSIIDDNIPTPPSQNPADMYSDTSVSDDSNNTNPQTSSEDNNTKEKNSDAVNTPDETAPDKDVSSKTDNSNEENKSDDSNKSSEKVEESEPNTDQKNNKNNIEKMDIRQVSALRVLSVALKALVDPKCTNSSCVSHDTREKLKSLAKVFDSLSSEPSCSAEAEYQENLLLLLGKKAIWKDNDTINERIEEVMSIPQLLESGVQYDENGNMKLDENGNVVNEFSNIIKNITSIEGKNVSEINECNLHNIFATVTNDYSITSDKEFKFNLGDKLNDEMINKIVKCKTEEELLHLINTDIQFMSIMIDFSRLALTTQEEIAQKVDSSTSTEIVASDSPESVQHNDEGRGYGD